MRMDRICDGLWRPLAPERSEVAPAFSPPLQRWVNNPPKIRMPEARRFFQPREAYPVVH